MEGLIGLSNESCAVAGVQLQEAVERTLNVERVGMKCHQQVFTVLLVLMLALAGLRSAAAEVRFETDVRPILAKRCLMCHQGAAAQKGLRLTSVADLLGGGASGPAIVPGDPGASLLLAMAAGDDPAMPPVGEPLTPDEVAVLSSWIEAGAPQDELSRDHS